MTFGKIFTTQMNKETETELRVLSDERALLDVDTISAMGLKGSWRWHFGIVGRLGYFSTIGGREVVIHWDEGGSSRMQGSLSDGQWEIFRLAYEGSGKIALLSDKGEALSDSWKFDYRFIEAQKV